MSQLPQNHWLCREKALLRLHSSSRVSTNSLRYGCFGIDYIGLIEDDRGLVRWKIVLYEVNMKVYESWPSAGGILLYFWLSVFLLLELDSISGPLFLAFAWVEKTKTTFFCRKTVAWKSLFNKLQMDSNGMHFSNLKFVYKSKTGKWKTHFMIFMKLSTVSNLHCNS